MNFADWLARWGEERLAENITGSQKCYRKMWEDRNDEISLFVAPAWELRLGTYWEENQDEWRERWRKCGGKLYEGRMIATKWDALWASLSSTFYDGLGEPYPPYARSSCARWMDLGRDEAIVMGVVSEVEFESLMASFPPAARLLDRDGKPITGKFLEQASQNLKEDVYRHGGPKPGASRAERVAHWRKLRQQSNERMRNRNRDAQSKQEAQNATFRLLEEVERSLKDQPIVNDKRRWNWMCESLKALTATTCFERYPNWKSRTWLACAEMHKLALAPADELGSLRYALQFNPKLAVKRRIKALEQQLNSTDSP